MNVRNVLIPKHGTAIIGARYARVGIRRKRDSEIVQVIGMLEFDG
jgi:hypothetical protein